jgi:hypothetical protein
MNYLALLGWSTDTGEEIMTQDELIPSSIFQG